jgi:hypothetical protein
MMVTNPPNRNGKSLSQLSNLLLFSALIALFALDTALSHPSLWGFIALAALWGRLRLVNYRFKVKKSFRLLPFAFCLLTCLGLPLLLGGWAEPSHAILLTDAQTFFTNNLTTSGTASQATAVNMIFNVARGLYIFYLIVAVVGAWQTAQRDEDWVPVIKVPVMSLLAIFGLDVMTSLIIT